MHPLVDVKHVLSCPSLCLLSVVLCISECCAELYNPRVMTSQTEGALSFLKRKGCAILLRASDYTECIYFQVPSYLLSSAPLKYTFRWIKNCHKPTAYDSTTQL